MRNELKVYNLSVQNEIKKKETEEIEIKRQLKAYLSDLKEKLSTLYVQEKDLEEYNQGMSLSYSDSEFGGNNRFFEDGNDDDTVSIENIKKSIKDIHDYMNELDLRKINISDEINELERIEKITTENFLKINKSQLN